jgi:hypothetical protein
MLIRLSSFAAGMLSLCLWFSSSVAQDANLWFDSVAVTPDSASCTLGCGTIPKPSAAAATTRFRHIEGYSGVYLLRGGGIYRDETGFEVPLRAGDWFHRIPEREHESIPDESGLWLEFYIFVPVSWYELHQSTGLFSANEPVWSPGLDTSLLERVLELREQSGTLLDFTRQRLWLLCRPVPRRS